MAWLVSADLAALAAQAVFKVPDPALVAIPMIPNKLLSPPPPTSLLAASSHRTRTLARAGARPSEFVLGKRETQAFELYMRALLLTLLTESPTPPNSAGPDWVGSRLVQLLR